MFISFWTTFMSQQPFSLKVEMTWSIADTYMRNCVPAPGSQILIYYTIICLGTKSLSNLSCALNVDWYLVKACEKHGNISHATRCSVPKFAETTTSIYRMGK